MRSKLIALQFMGCTISSKYSEHEEIYIFADKLILVTHNNSQTINMYRVISENFYS